MIDRCFGSTQPTLIVAWTGKYVLCVCPAPSDTPNAEAGWSAERAKAFETDHKIKSIDACVLCVCRAPADTPNAETGWSPERAKAFGASHVTAFVNTVPTLLKERATKDEQQQ